LNYFFNPEKSMARNLPIYFISHFKTEIVTKMKNPPDIRGRQKNHGNKIVLKKEL
jgi:hypothetical protein